MITLNYTLNDAGGPAILPNDLNGAIQAIFEREAYAVANGIGNRSYTIVIAPHAQNEAPAQSAAAQEFEPVTQSDAATSEPSTQ